MAVKSHEYKNPFGVVEIRNLEIRGYQEKPVTISQVNAGIYVLSPQSLDLLQEDQPCDMSTLFQCMLAESQKVVAYPLYEDWRDIGNPIDLKEARIEHTQKVNDV
jgi:NDP-sugar pyrophosphorylase family protein